MAKHVMRYDSVAVRGADHKTDFNFITLLLATL